MAGQPKYEYFQYVRTSLTDFLSVRAIVSVLHVELKNRVCDGESHDFPELLYVESGHHTLKVDGIRHTMEPGQLIFYAPQAFHEGDEASSAKLGIISFEAELPELFPFYNRVITLTAQQQALLSRILAQGLRAFRDAPRAQGLHGQIPREDIPDYTLQQLKNQLELFLIELYDAGEPKKSGSVRVNRKNFRSQQWEEVACFLKEHLGENLTLAQIAEGCAMSVPALKLLCRQQQGCGPIACFIGFKIQAAKEMIRTSSMSFTQISQQLGFQSLHYFSKLFKEKTGMTPSEYAKTIYEN